ncbi:hypothetical protein BD414DRAFT_495902 [Trametes punicea]|nr:hypothetical protein BD414DRAFT_495902 [Trametes punicea]
MPSVKTRLIYLAADCPEPYPAALCQGHIHALRVTGGEHQDISHIPLGLIIGLPLRDDVSACLICATRAMLYVLCLVQYMTHTTRTLKLLDGKLFAFHAAKSILVDLGIHEHFRLPEQHTLEHYRQSIELFSITGNYDTLYSEHDAVAGAQKEGSMP